MLENEDALGPGSYDVVVAVCTFRRPKGLSSVLHAVDRQSCRNFRLGILVVDNDPSGSAQAGVEQAQLSAHHDIIYIHASTKGLVHARNVALNFVRDAQPCLVFVDDDEVPSDGWLEAFWNTHLADSRAIVAGPVRPVFEEALPTWCPNGRFWLRREYVDGVLIHDFVPDGNILYPPALLADGWQYDVNYNTSGGQETDLQKRWLSEGRPIRWSSSAVVLESIPAGRMTLKYARDRVYFGSLTYTWVMAKDVRSVPSVLIRGLRQCVIGFLRCAFGTLSCSRPMIASGLLSLSKAHGTVAGLLVKSYDRYGSYQIDPAGGSQSK